VRPHPPHTRTLDKVPPQCNTLEKEEPPLGPASWKNVPPQVGGQLEKCAPPSSLGPGLMFENWQASAWAESQALSHPRDLAILRVHDVASCGSPGMGPFAGF